MKHQTWMLEDITARNLRIAAAQRDAFDEAWRTTIEGWDLDIFPDREVPAPMPLNRIREPYRSFARAARNS